jgi:cytochrome c
MKKTIVAAFGVALALGLPARAEFTYPNCDPLKPADFKATELFNKLGTNGALARDTSGNEPVQFALHGVKVDGALDHVDIYYVQRFGEVKYYDGAAHRVSNMGKFAVQAKGAYNDNGLMGIAVDPAFDLNRRLYFWYVPPVANTNDNRRLRLSRVVVKPDNTLDMASEKILIDIQGSKSDKYHSGGPMEFDAYGDLWIQIGNNSDDVVDGTDPKNPYSQFDRKDPASSEEWGPSNTASMRGGTIRIHPDESAKGYAIPSGNFGEYWSAYFKSRGNDTLAAQYLDPAKVLPEVYVKGERSNYSLSVHPTKRWAAWGTVNYKSSLDEFNITSHPIFAGFPYFHGDNQAVPGLNEVLKGMDPDHPVNTSPFNTGVTELPPATPGMLINFANTAIGGPIYVYDPGLASKTKFPPHLNNTWIGFNWFQSLMYFFDLDTVNLAVTRKTEVSGAGNLFAAVPLRRPLEAKYGPDGALYILNYDGYYTQRNAGVTRVDYVGKCAVTDVAAAPRPAARLSIRLSSFRLEVTEPGDHEFGLFDPSGRKVFAARGLQGAVYDLDRLRAKLGLKKRVHFVSVKTSRGVYNGTVSFL